MSKRYIPSANDFHQQDGGLSLQEFAAKEGISDSYLRRLIRCGLVLGASKHPLSKKWRIYPPARIADSSCSIRPTIRKRGTVGQRGADALGAVEVVDVGTSTM
ncbi:MAG: hypothetical protein HY936_10450 [Nitrosomonadales bacterium]|nr:hypothetical protein [Nitrosomonadales bacterium]